MKGNCSRCALPYSEHAEAFGLSNGGINNCALRAGYPAEECHMCSGRCHPIHTFTLSDICRFDGDNRFLSNFYPWDPGGVLLPDPITVVAYGRAFPSSEHAFQAAKCAYVEDYAKFQVSNLSANGAKKLGRTIHLRADWEEAKIQVMTGIVWDKFTRNKHLGELLLNTGKARLVEGNTWGDTFWGVCNGVGKNHLGRILMEVRKGMGGG